jgi:hypothetical protein
MEKLEAGIIGDGDECRCPAGAFDIRVRDDGEPEDESPAKVCGVCGLPQRLIRIRVVLGDRDDDLLEVPADVPERIARVYGR